MQTDARVEMGLPAKEKPDRNISEDSNPSPSAKLFHWLRHDWCAWTDIDKYVSHSQIRYCKICNKAQEKIC